MKVVLVFFTVVYSNLRVPHRFHRKPGLCEVCGGLLDVDGFDVFD